MLGNLGLEWWSAIGASIGQECAGDEATMEVYCYAISAIIYTFPELEDPEATLDPYSAMVCLISSVLL